MHSSLASAGFSAIDNVIVDQTGAVDHFDNLRKNTLGAVDIAGLEGERGQLLRARNTISVIVGRMCLPGFWK